MSGVFIDGGAHKATTCAKMRHELPGCRYVAFEPVDYREFFRPYPDVEYHQEAIWVEDAVLPFYLGVDSLSSSAYREKTMPMDRDHPIMVKYVDFSAWLLRNFTAKDDVTLKFDIEGSEYVVLEKMIRDGSIKLIKTFYCEWHYDRIPTIGKMRHDAVISEVSKYVRPQYWA